MMMEITFITLICRGCIDVSKRGNFFVIDNTDIGASVYRRRNPLALVRMIKLNSRSKQLQQIVFICGGNAVVATDGNNMLTIYNLLSGKTVRQLGRNEGETQAIAVSISYTL
jgi:hypothetical protein